jgi:hypothetical protein
LAQAIVANRAEGFEPHKAEAFKASWEKDHCKMFCENRNGFVGKLEFIRENEVSRRLKRLLNN